MTCFQAPHTLLLRPPIRDILEPRLHSWRMRAGTGLRIRVRILLRWRAAGGEHLLEAALLVGLLYRRAGDQEKPIVAEVEVEDHLPLRPKHRRDQRLLHAGPLLAFKSVRKERVALLAAVGILEVVAKLKGMVQSKPTVLMMNSAKS